jgi:hypothetical protein
MLEKLLLKFDFGVPAGTEGEQMSEITYQMESWPALYN